MELKRGVTWHDGQPFTADDVVFNWQFAIDPAAATVTIGNYRNLKIEKLDSHSVRVVFSAPSPFWPGQYSQVMLVPRHLFVAFSGAKAREAPSNNRPVGTGAYSVVDFKPSDLLHASLNPSANVRRHPARKWHQSGTNQKTEGSDIAVRPLDLPMVGRASSPPI